MRVHSAWTPFDRLTLVAFLVVGLTANIFLLRIVTPPVPSLEMEAKLVDLMNSRPPHPQVMAQLEKLRGDLYQAQSERNDIQTHVSELEHRLDMAYCTSLRRHFARELRGIGHALKEPKEP